MIDILNILNPNSIKKVAIKLKVKKCNYIKHWGD